MATKIVDNRSRVTPPPPLRSWDGQRPEGAEVFYEVDGDLGVLLWSGLRRVHSWIAARDEKERPNISPLEIADAPVERVDDSGPRAVPEVEHPLFAAARDQAPELSDALRVFDLLYRATDLLLDTQLVKACEEVWMWAEGKELLGTAAYFAEAEAYIDSESPARANEAGRLCRRAALNFRAAMWFYRAHGLGVRSRTRTQCTIALLRYGVLQHRIGSYDEAELYLIRAKRRALRAGQRREAAFAHHELLGLAAEARSYEYGEQHFLEALWLYPRNHERLPYLAYDFTYLLCEKRLYSFAVSLIPLVLPRIRSPAVLALVWGNAARAYAAAGRREEYREAVDRAVELASMHQENASGALTMAAVAAWIANDLDQAESMATRGHKAAAARKELVALRRAADLLHGISTGLSAPMEVEAPIAHQVGVACRQCAARLRKWKPRS
jgi:tetratricopeptide (TPR) repeat protein